MDLPYQASSAPDAPQLVMNNSKIRLNGEHIEMARKEWAVAQFHKQRRKKLQDAPTEDVWLEFLRTSSTETINQVLNEIADTVPASPGLNSFRMNGCWDNNTVDQWPITQLANKT